MNDMVVKQATPFKVTPQLVGGIMVAAGGAEGAESRLQGVAWLMVNEEAAGVSRGDVARNLGVDLGELEELRRYVCLNCGFSSPDSESKTLEEIAECDPIWNQGLAAIRTTAMLIQQAIGTGWDQVEAMAIEKVASYLNQMQALGNPMEMLEIAAKANKAIRRGRGEGGRGNGGYGMAGSQKAEGHSEIDASISIPAGNGGTMTLTLSQRVREQIQNPHAPVIDGKEEVKTGGLRALEMLGIEDTRKLVETQDERENQRKVQGPFGELSGFDDFLRVKEEEQDE